MSENIFSSYYPLKTIAQKTMGSLLLDCVKNKDEIVAEHHKKEPRIPLVS